MNIDVCCGDCGATRPSGDRYCTVSGSRLFADEAREVRKYVTVLFIDLIGSTTLAERFDPELLRTVLDRYYRICTASVTQFGGVVEKFIGDAVMAVFGIPIGHEDDALRAVRAAAAARQVVAELDLAVHCGLASGEAVVVTRPGAEIRVVGDVVHTASRLQSAAGAGEILVGDDVARAVRTKVRLTALPPLALKGKANSVLAWRLEDLTPASDTRPPLPLIGRADELKQIQQGFARVRHGRQLCMMSVLGVPGVGKSRLVHEFLDRLAADDATVLLGSCPSNGIGLTYRPLAQLLDSLPQGWADVESALSAEPEGARALLGLACAVGRAEASQGCGVEEISWAARLLVESLARHKPLILVVDDLHWAEETLLDLLTAVATWVTAVPVFLLCVARTDLLERRTTWGGGIACASTLELRPLSSAETVELITHFAERREVVAQDADDDVDFSQVRDRVLVQCDGNPLFAELMLEGLVDAGSGADIPPTIRALLEARLDRLPADERGVLERAATIGNPFSLAQLNALADQRGTGFAAELDHIIRRLLRRRLILRSTRAGEFRFETILLRDAAYAMTSKVQRASWHLILADLASPADDDLAHRLEASCLLRREIQHADPSLLELTEKAARALIAAGTRAHHRKDLPAAISLLERGRELLPAADPEHRHLAIRISDAWIGLGNRDAAETALDHAERIASADPRTQRICLIQRRTLALRAGDRLHDAAALAADLDSDPHDDVSWCRFHQLQALHHLAEGEIGVAEQAMRSALHRAVAANSRYDEERVLGAICEIAQWSPTHIRDCLPVCEELVRRFAADRALAVPVILSLARLQALSGNIKVARDALETARGYVSDLRLTLAGVAVSQVYGLVESLSGLHLEAAQHFADAAEGLRGVGQPVTAATLDAYAARELLRKGHLAGAADAVAKVMAQSMDLRGRLTLLTLNARLSAAAGDRGKAVAAAGRAIDKVEQTDDPCLRGDVLFESAQAFAAVNERKPAIGIASHALENYMAKGATLPGQHVKSWLALKGNSDG